MHILFRDTDQFVGLPLLIKNYPKAMDDIVKPFMGRLISTTQSASIGGRNIMDGVMS